MKIVVAFQPDSGSGHAISHFKIRGRVVKPSKFIYCEIIGDGFRFLLEESQNKNWDGCPLFFIKRKDQDIERLKRGGCYEREKQRGKGKQEGAAEKPQRKEKDEEGEEEQVGLEEAFWVTS